MLFQPIDRATWSREEYFSTYFDTTPCTYSLTTKIDISNIRKQHLKLYPSMLYAITRTVNNHEAFRTSINDENILGVYASMHPMYTVFHDTSKTFSCIWTEFSMDYSAFIYNYKADKNTFGKNECIIAKPNAPCNIFNISMIPWISFDNFNLNLQKGYTYTLPIFTIGKFEVDGNRCQLPISVQVHHAVCDGYHVSCFINDLQELLSNFSS